MADDSPPTLIHHDSETYGNSFKADLFEQYKSYVESAEKISERRVRANNYLLSVNASMLTLYGILSTADQHGYWIILLPIAGILVALTWHGIVTSYRDLNSVKFAVIHELEQHMPAALYAYEWHKAEEGKGNKYHPTSHFERWVPGIFVCLYIILAIMGIAKWAGGAG